MIHVGTPWKGDGEELMTRRVDQVFLQPLKPWNTHWFKEDTMIRLAEVPAAHCGRSLGLLMTKEVRT